MRLGTALRELHRSEDELASKLLHVSGWHKADHEVYYLGRDLAAWAQRHVRELSEHGQRYGVDLDPEPKGESGLVARAADAVSTAVGREPEAALLLLVDLRETYLRAAGVSADWELVAQAAQGVQDVELLGLAERCHPESIRIMKWANAKLKESATQALVS